MIKIKAIITTIGLLCAVATPAVVSTTVFAAQVPGGGGSPTTTPEGDAAKKTSFTINGKTSNVTIRDLAVEVLKFLNVAVGIAVVGGITAGGIVYSTAEGNPGKAQKGITIITNAVLGLVLYLLMYAIMNFLVPGGVL